MKVVAIACVRDEIDIIEAFVRHSLMIVSQLVVLDNGSSDGTRDVLQALHREGLPLEIVDDPVPGKHLSARLTRLMRDYAIARYAADWIVPLDADEFLVPTGDQLLISEQAESDNPLQLFWSHYVPDETDDPLQSNAVLRLSHRLAVEQFPAHKVIVPAGLGRLPGAVIDQGSHTLSIAGRVCEALPCPQAWLAHFPIRSAEQFIAKTVIGYLQNEAMAKRDVGWGWHHREHFERFLRDPAGFGRDFTTAARRYGNPLALDALPDTILDPLPYRGGPLRYTPATDDLARAWQPVLRYAQDLARRHGMLCASLDGDGRLTLEKQGDLFVHVCSQLAQRDKERLAQWHEIQLLQQSQAVLRKELEEVRYDHADAKRRMQQEMAQTWTWRVGRAMLWPLRRLRRTWARFGAKRPGPW